MNLPEDAAERVAAVMRERQVDNAVRKWTDQIQVDALRGLPEHATGPQGAAARAIGHTGRARR